MDVKNNQRNEFYIDLGSGEKARLEYKRSTGVLDLISTQAPESARGKNIGEHLLKEAFKFADQNNLKIVATCPYVKHWFGKHPEEQKRLSSGQDYHSSSPTA